jgi:hypothetical protein
VQQTPGYKGSLGGGGGGVRGSATGGGATVRLPPQAAGGRGQRGQSAREGGEPEHGRGREEENEYTWRRLGGVAR